MPRYTPAEQQALDAYDRLVETRKRAEAGEVSWQALADHFTEEATFLDPAWGRIQGIAEIQKFMSESMAGLEGWTFPREWTVVEGDRLISGWQNRLPGERLDGTPYQALGISVLRYAGDGKFG
ncbi:MAG: nuclear transport factor 2 family protein [Myxococcales bacterium]|nr:nuclear transport factor 2 family protein [Myxococcales bacterium]